MTDYAVPLVSRTAIDAKDVAMDTILAVPAAEGPFPAMIVVHENLGLSDENPGAGPYIRDVCTRLAENGHVALAPNLFARGQGPKELHDAQVIADLQAAFNALAARSDVRASRIGVMGFCMGGCYALLLACSQPELAACASFYGRVRYAELSEQKPISPIDLIPIIACPLIGVYGELDHIVTQDDVALLRGTLDKNDKEYEIYSYPGALHAFCNHRRDRYHPQAAEDAWAKTLAFFAKHLT